MSADPGKHTVVVTIPRDAAAVQRIHIPGHFPSLNELIAAAKGHGGRGIAYAKMKRQWTELVWALAKSAKLKPVQRARLHFVWVEKDKRRDPSNVAATGRKFCEDGLVMAGVLSGDGWAGIAGFSDDFIVDPSRHGVDITIREE